MYKTIWESYLNTNEYPKLENDMEIDVLVIGGGIAGLLTAKKLSDNNIKTIVVEKNKIGRGTTANTTAFLTIQHETLYQSLPREKALQYLNINKAALKEYEELSNKYNFDYKKVESCLFSKDKEKIKKEFLVLNDLDQDVMLLEDIPFEKNVLGVALKNQAMINPSKLINCITEDLEVYENTEVIRLEANYAILKNKCKIKFNNVVIATHYPINNKFNLLFMNLTQRKSYVVVIKKETFNNTYCSIDEDGMYYRMIDDYIIVGGNDTDTGNICKEDFEIKVCEKFNIQKEEILYSWVGQDCITTDGIPYIGYSDLFHKNHIIITGFNLWGFTWAMASSNIVLQMIKKNKICELTKINRLTLNKNLLKNVKKSVTNLLTLKKPKCTHLGCALIYNKKEHVWECPCHGSIYDTENNVIEGPANKKIKEKT